MLRAATHSIVRDTYMVLNRHSPIFAGKGGEDEENSKQLFSSKSVDINKS
jgi:hypothetical protein